MVDQTDIQLTRFLNTTMRPLADNLVGLKQALVVAKPQYNTTYKPILEGWNDVDEVIDGPVNDDRGTLTVAEWKRVSVVLTSLDNLLDGPLFAALIRAAANPRNPVSGD